MLEGEISIRSTTEKTDQMNEDDENPVDNEISRVRKGETFGEAAIRDETQREFSAKCM